MSLVNFNAQNHPQQTKRRGAIDAVDDRQTPPELMLALRERFAFTLDAAASVENRQCEHYWSLEQDGLMQPWSGVVWCNPPYSDLGAWVRKAWAEIARKGGPETVVMLVPANRTEQGWWQREVEPFRDKGSGLRVEFLPGRMRFKRPDWVPGPKGDRPPFGCCLLIFTRKA